MASAPKKIEVNRDLINSHFQSYRFNREVKCSVFTQRLPDSKLHSFKLNDSDYSYCHAAMSSSINNLYHSQFDPDKVYLISDDGSVLVAVLNNTEDGTPSFELKSLFTIPGKETLSETQWNNLNIIHF